MRRSPIKKLLPWAGAFVQPVTILGVAMIITLWSGFAYHLNSEYHRAIQVNTQETSNLGRVLEENLSRTIQSIDRTLNFFRLSWNSSTLDKDLERWASEMGRHDVELQISFIDAQGMLKASSLGPILKPTDLSDREHYRVHLGHSRDELFISKPVIGRMSGKWSIQLSRPIRDADGKLSGVVVASVDPFYWVRVFNAVNLGKDGSIVLFGTDGVIRAATGFDGKNIGRSMADAPIFSRAAQRPIDTYLVTNGAYDGILRLLSYRVFKDFPLIIAVGVSQNEMFAVYNRNLLVFSISASLLTGLILYVMWFGVQRQNKIDSFRAAWKASEAVAKEKSRVLGITLENINQGIMMIDPEGNVAVINRRLIDLLELPEKFLGHRTKLSEILQYLWDRGEFGEDGESLDAPVRNMLRCQNGSDSVPRYERVRPNGVVLEIVSHMLDDGSVVRTFTDITERKRSESQIAHMAHHDNLTNLPNRVLLNDRLDQAIARMKRQKTGFALLCLDLDGFKKVNDTFGHAAGDLLLKEVSQRLARCVREVDTLSRIGGDEFVILQEGTTEEAQAIILAERIKQATGVPCSINGNDVMVGTSIGIALAPRDGTDAAELMRNADKALYRAKSKGRNLFSFVNGDKYAVVKPKGMSNAAAPDTSVGPAEETVTLDDDVPLMPYADEKKSEIV